MRLKTKEKQSSVNKRSINLKKKTMEINLKNRLIRINKD